MRFYFAAHFCVLLLVEGSRYASALGISQATFSSSRITAKHYPHYDTPDREVRVTLIESHFDGAMFVNGTTPLQDCYRDTFDPLHRLPDVATLRCGDDQYTSSLCSLDTVGIPTTPCVLPIDRLDRMLSASAAMLQASSRCATSSQCLALAFVQPGHGNGNQSLSVAIHNCSVQIMGGVDYLTDDAGRVFGGEFHMSPSTKSDSLMEAMHQTLHLARQASKEDFVMDLQRHVGHDVLFSSDFWDIDLSLIEAPSFLEEDQGTAALTKLGLEGMKAFGQDVAKKTEIVLLEEEAQSSFFIGDILKLVIAPFVAVVLDPITAPVTRSGSKMGSGAISGGMMGPIAGIIIMLIVVIMGLLVSIMVADILSEAIGYHATWESIDAIACKIPPAIIEEVMNDLNEYLFYTALPMQKDIIIALCSDALSDSITYALHHTLTHTLTQSLTQSLSQPTTHYYYCVYCYYYGSYCDVCFKVTDYKMLHRQWWMGSTESAVMD